MAVITQTNTSGVTIRDVIGQQEGILTEGESISGFFSGALSQFKQAYVATRLALETQKLSDIPLTSGFTVQSVINMGTPATLNIVSQE